MIPIDPISESELTKLRVAQFDELTAQGYSYDMIEDEFRSPSGLIVPAWPPAIKDE